MGCSCETCKIDYSALNRKPYSFPTNIPIDDRMRKTVSELVKEEGNTIRKPAFSKN